MKALKTCFSLLFLVVCLSLHAKPIVIGNLEGQLGNQFFIIAATTSLALDHNAKAIFPDLKTMTKYNVPINYKKVFSHLSTTQPKNKEIAYKFMENGFNYKPIPFVKNMSIRGYFQSEKYFLNHKAEILELFKIPKQINRYLQQHYASIINHPKTVALHIRSYLKEDPKQEFFYTLDAEYYKKAITYFDEDSAFIVFTNDLKYAKSILSSINKKFIYIENEPHYHDLYLMSLCKHQVIANSSFSWWGAYLNANEDKMVLAPSHWFKPEPNLDTQDLIPPEWIIVDLDD